MVRALSPTAGSSARAPCDADLLVDYAWLALHTGCGSYSKFCSEANQRKQWEQAVAAGCDGFVVWGGGKATPEGCRTFEIYVSTVLGPVARNVTKRRVTSSASGSVLSSGPHRYVGNLPGILPGTSALTYFGILFTLLSKFCQSAPAC